MTDILYQQEETCPVCGTRFPVTKVRKSRVAVSGRDSDFCLHYEGVNPNLYTIWVCPRCSYAAPDTSFRELADYQKRLVLESLRQGVPYQRDFSGQRTPEVAVEAYLLAAHFGRITRLKDSSMAGIYLRAAWLYREMGRDQEEREMLELALQHYRQAYDRETFPIGKMSELMVQYLMAEIMRRLGQYKEAIQWFSRIVSDPRGRREPQLVAQARDMWYLAKEALEKGVETQNPQKDQKTASSPEAAGGSRSAPAVNGPKEEVRDESGRRPAVEATGAGSQGTRDRVSVMVSLYTDQVEWLKGLAGQGGLDKTADLSAILRSLLDGLRKVGLEERLTAKPGETMEEVIEELWARKGSN